MAPIILKSLSFILIIILGNVLKNRGFFDRSHANLLSKIIMKITLPCALLANTSTYEITSTVFMLISFAIFSSLILSFFGRFIFRNDTKVMQGTAMINCSGYNVGNLTLPFVSTFYPGAGLAYMAMFDLGNALMGLGGTFALTASVLDERRRGIDFSMIFNNLKRSLPFLTYVGLFTLSLLRLTLPAAIQSTAASVGGANTFLSMLMIGILLDFSLDPQDIKKLCKLILIRLGGSFGMGSIVFFLLPIDIIAKQVVILCLFSSCVSVAPIYSQILGDESSVPAILNSITIVIAIMMTSVLLMVFQAG